jgi:hypothetical protein
VDLIGRARLSASPDRVFGVVADLTTYPSWLGIVRSVVPDGDGWYVEVGAKLGPFWRTKRVRMVRTECEPPSRVRFERHERDGREHSPWTLTAEIAPPVLTMHLHYGGRLWLPLLEPVLNEEIRRAGSRLEAHLA